MPRVTHRYETAWGGFKQTFWKWFDFSLINCGKQTKSILNFFFLEVSALCDKFHTLLPGSVSWAWAHSAFYHSASNCVTSFSCGDTGFTTDTHRVLPKLSDFYGALLYVDWAGLCSGTQRLDSNFSHNLSNISLPSNLTWQIQSWNLWKRLFKIIQWLNCYDTLPHFYLTLRFIPC